MKRLLAWGIASLCLLSPSLARTSTAIDFGPLIRCVGEVKSEHAHYRHLIPSAIYSMDRRLYQMSFGVPVLEQNLTMLQNRYADGKTDPEDRHLVFNATAGCLTFQASFSSRIRLFLALCFCVLLLIVILIIRATYSLYRPTKALPQDKPSSPVSSQGKSGAN